MEHDNLTRHVASYGDAAAANDASRALKDARAAGLDIVGDGLRRRRQGDEGGSDSVDQITDSIESES